MKTFRKKSVPFALLGLFVFLGGCATKIPPMPPLTDLGTRQCATTPDFAHATPLPLNPREKTVKKITINAKTACLNDAAGPSLYVVYALPVSDKRYTVSVTSVPDGTTLFAPRVLLYGADGTLKRSFVGKQISFRGTSLSLYFLSHPGERYLVVASDPAAVGGKHDMIQSSTQVTPVMAYPFYFEMHTGSDTEIRDTFAYNGELEIRIIPPPKK